MDIYNFKNEITKKPIAEIPLRVVFYARVSTDSDEQLNSLENQKSYYENFIKDRAAWVNCGGYIDEGLSGVTTNKRVQFNKMIADAKMNKFDLIITKEVSRFARNIADTFNRIEELHRHGVALYFERENLISCDNQGTLLLGIMSTMAENESRKLSDRITFGHHESIKNGVVLGNNKIYGYEKDKGKLVIIEKEAEMVRKIFNLYATGEYSTPKLEVLLEREGYRNTKGGKIGRDVIKRIILNPKYKGWYCGNKVKVTDMRTKKQKFVDKSEWVMYKDHDKVPPIVDEETWDKANEIMEVRSQEIKQRRSSFKTDNLFTGKIICAEHNAPFWLKTRKSRKNRDDATWVCSHRIKNGKESCNTFAIKESELVEILIDVLKGMASNIDDVVNKYIDYIKKTLATVDYVGKVKQLEEEKLQQNKRKDKLLDLVTNDAISNKEFKEKNEALNVSINQIEEEIQKIKKQKENQNESLAGIFRLKTELVRLCEFGNIELTPGIVNTFIDKILVYSTEEGDTMRLQIFLKTGQVTDKSILSRSGGTIKKMIEAQERQMAGKSSNMQ